MSLAILFHFLCTQHVSDILISETCWVHKKWNKIVSDIKLVFYSSTITMMHGPINISDLMSLLWNCMLVIQAVTLLCTVTLRFVISSVPWWMCRVQEAFFGYWRWQKKLTLVMGGPPLLLLRDGLQGVGLRFSISSFRYKFTFTDKSMQDTQQ